MVKLTFKHVIDMTSLSSGSCARCRSVAPPAGTTEHTLIEALVNILTVRSTDSLSSVVSVGSTLGFETQPQTFNAKHQTFEKNRVSAESSRSLPLSGNRVMD